MKYNRYFSQLITTLICLRRRSRYRILILLVLVLNIFLLIIIFIYKHYFTCLHSEVVQAVSLICKHYIDGKALGNLCHDLCISEVLKPTDCQPHHVGKDVVFKAMWGERKLVLKGSMMDENQYDPVYWTDENGSAVYPDVKIFYKMIYDTISRNLNTSCINNDNMLTKLWTANISDISHLSTDMQHIAMNNIWHLLQQTEYLFSKCLEDQNIFPKIIGSCGYIYAVEYTQPLQNFMLVLYPTWQEDFYKRTEIAKLLLEYVKMLDNDHMKTELGKIHLCDVKIGHFGRDVNDKIKLLDVDMVFFESVLLDNIRITKKCSNHQDCSFIDCKGSCNFTSGQCSLIVQDDNLQRICRNIFSGHIMKRFGLLSSPPIDIASKLQDILEKCIEGNAKDYVLDQLYKLFDKH
ncbi:protein FAM69C-like isoform X1 [Centruroides sculpturatus]|uniref:protein FAM69C-like isoform X1 n=1 Tax=Centruroides sculpturatus TaxID=218467 RepID=UPI000C6CB7E2|nr:protein FAM69C-like isoform X1 [Centruroides sculpturatus]